jgi:hypothetical protein
VFDLSWHLEVAHELLSVCRLEREVREALRHVLRSRPAIAIGILAAAVLSLLLVLPDGPQPTAADRRGGGRRGVRCRVGPDGARVVVPLGEAALKFLSD